MLTHLHLFIIIISFISFSGSHASTFLFYCQFFSLMSTLRLLMSAVAAQLNSTTSLKVPGELLNVNPIIKDHQQHQNIPLTACN